jgi:hypothetical protein
MRGEAIMFLCVLCIAIILTITLAVLTIGTTQ